MLCKLYTVRVKSYTNCVNSRFFVAILPSFWFTPLCVKFWPKKLRSGRIFDIYHVWRVSASGSNRNASSSIMVKMRYFISLNHLGPAFQKVWHMLCLGLTVVYGKVESSC